MREHGATRLCPPYSCCAWAWRCAPLPILRLATLAATQRARPPKGFEAQSRKGSQGSRGRLKSAATVKSFSSAAHPNSFWHERAIKKIKPGHKERPLPCSAGLLVHFGAALRSCVTVRAAAFCTPCQWSAGTMPVKAGAKNAEASVEPSIPVPTRTSITTTALRMEAGRLTAVVDMGCSFLELGAAQCHSIQRSVACCAVD